MIFTISYGSSCKKLSEITKNSRKYRIFYIFLNYIFFYILLDCLYNKKNCKLNFCRGSKVIWSRGSYDPLVQKDKWWCLIFLKCLLETAALIFHSYKKDISSFFYIHIWKSEEKNSSVWFKKKNIGKRTIKETFWEHCLNALLLEPNVIS